MTWSAQFEADLQAQSLAPVFVLHILKWAGTPGRQFYAASSGDYGYPEIIGSEVSIGGSSITPVGWRYTHGTCSIQIVGDSITDLAKAANRGAIAVLKMGFPGYTLAELQPVFTGRVNTILGRGPTWTLELWDGTSLLTSRLLIGYTASYRSNEMNLFANVGDSTTLTSTYTVGDTVLDLTDASIMEESSISGGAVYVQPGGSTDPFFLTYDGTVGNQLQSVTTVDVLDTTRATASTGASTVSNAVYLRGTPAEIFLRLLVSGSGTSSAYDVYPASWGYGLPFDLVDWADCIGTLLAMQARLGTGPTYEVVFAQNEQVTDSWTWLLDWFTKLGLAPVQRHGLITLRPVQDPSDPAISSEMTITDMDIETVDEWIAYSPDVPAEYVQARVIITEAVSPFAMTARLTTMANPQTVPVADRLTYNNSDKFASFPTQVATELRDRLGPWGTGRSASTAGSGLPEQVTITCSGLRLAGLSVLDVVQVTTDEIRGGRLASTVDGWNAQPCMVLKCSPDFAAGRVTLTLAAIDPL